MESLAVAASAALVKPVIVKLSGKLWKDLSMFWGVDRECEKTTTMLTVISYVLVDAENKSITDDPIHQWLSQLQDVAYDIDDLLDDLQIEGQRNNRKSIVGSVRRFFSSDNQVKFRIKMVNKFKEINKRLDKIIEEKNRLELIEIERIIPPEEASTKRETHSSIDEMKVHGRNEEKEKIINLLIHEKNDEILSILPIVGMGGVGKTTLVQMVYEDRVIKSYFDPIVWVHVPMNFELGEILEKMIETISEKNCDVSHIEAKQKKLKSMISGTRFLVVLDDVWNEDAAKWEKLKTILKCGMVGSKIIVTTRSERVANIMGTFHQFRVNPLEFQYCWKLFEERAFQHVDDEKKENLVDIGKEIVKKCKGLPLAAIHLGNSACFWGDDWCTIRDSNIWQTSEYCDDEIMPSLILSYFYLPSHLKRCFKYCSLFPKGFTFRKETLTPLWICEGFIPNLESHRGAADTCFEFLLSQSIFEDNGKNLQGTHDYKMHDLIHDLACYVSGDRFFLRSQSNNMHSTVSCRYSSIFSKDISQMKKLRSLLLPACLDVGEKLDSLMKLQYLRVLDLSDCEIMELPCSIRNLRRLRYLNLSRNRNLRILPDSVTKLLNLKMLKLSECTNLQKIPIRLGALENLEVLNLYGCSAIINLPMSLCRLTNLRELNLTYCEGLGSIPKGLGELTKLERLPVFIVGGDGGCTISELHQLNFLKNDLRIVINEISALPDLSNANLEAKQNLTSIKIHLKGETYVDSDAVSIHQIGRLQLPCQLQTLCFWVDRTCPEDLLLPIGRSFPEMFLNIYGLMYDEFKNSFTLALPNSFRTMDFPIKYTKLVNVHLDGVNEYENFPQFGQLPQLKSLRLSLCFSITRIKEQFSGTCGMYPLLEELELWQLCQGDTAVPEGDILEETAAETETQMVVETEAMKMMFSCLKKLTLSSCPFIAVFPSLPRTIEDLVIIGDCGQQILSTISLQGLSRLRKLKLQSIPAESTDFEGMMHLKALGELTIMFCKWSYLPPGLLHHHLPSLKNVRIAWMDQLCMMGAMGGSGSWFVPPNFLPTPPPLLFFYLENLEILCCRSLAGLPSWLGHLSFLRSLTVHSCPMIKELPDNNIAHLTALRKLQLSNLNIQRLPESFEHLKALQSLILFCLPNLQKLPKGTERLSPNQLRMFSCYRLSRQ